MEGKARVLAALAVIIAALAGYMLGNIMATPDYYIGDYEGNVLRVELYVYRNGELIYYDPDDPATNNFLALLEALLDNDDDADDNVVARDGLTDNLEAWAVYMRDLGRAIVMVSNGTATFSRTMSDLPGTIWLNWATATIQNNELVISGTITIDASTNITYVGLAMWHAGTEDTATLGQASNEILLFADELSSPISVKAGDVVTVVYKIVVP